MKFEWFENLNYYSTWQMLVVNKYYVRDRDYSSVLINSLWTLTITVDIMSRFKKVGQVPNKMKFAMWVLLFKV